MNNKQIRVGLEVNLKLLVQDKITRGYHEEESTGVITDIQGRAVHVKCNGQTFIRSAAELRPVNPGEIMV